VIDSLVICCFVRDAYEWEDLARLYSYATGLEMSAAQLKEAGARAINVARRFSTREGIGRKDDALPKLFHEAPFADGSSKVHVVVKADFERMLDEYYQARGWTDDGIPPAEP
jgi:aldehyde:ferredoxin oxidoreductase